MIIDTSEAARRLGVGRCRVIQLIRAGRVQGAVKVGRGEQAMETICDSDGIPCCKLHGLRMLNPELFTRFPLASADSTNIARNIKLDSAWRGTYPPPTRPARAYVLRQRIESHNAPQVWSWARAYQQPGSLF